MCEFTPNSRELVRTMLEEANKESDAYTKVETAVTHIQEIVENHLTCELIETRLEEVYEEAFDAGRAEAKSEESVENANFLAYLDWWAIQGIGKPNGANDKCGAAPD